MKIYLSVILLAIYLLFSCSQNEKSSLYDYNQYKIDSISFNLDDSTSNEFRLIEYLDSGDEDYLYHFNQFKSGIDKFSLSSGELIKTISYPNEEPHMIKLVQGISVVNEDSIFVIPSLKVRGMILIDDNGQLIHRYNPKEEIDFEKSIINHISFGAQKSEYRGGELHLIRYPLFDMSNPSNINDEFLFEVTYRVLENDFIFISESGFPSFYHDQIWVSNHLQVSRVFNEKERIYSWNLSDTLDIVNIKNGEKSRKVVKSIFKSNEIKPLASIPTREQKMEYTLTNLKYYGIYYDKYRQLYYRTVQLPGKYTNSINPKDIDAVRDFSIIILDKEFNVMKEVLFNGGIYNMYRVFVGKKGVYLPKNNHMFASQDEDKLIFDIFEFAK
ncbi:DUF4221 family protein [Litoribacter populi]|uniref:DUF4221 family protein n=1 Tax=Litoribacter populi TaxID=2598460 RepID=UPI00117EA878|nr:DUF4221 family protein [Litoribacter populi]